MSQFALPATLLIRLDAHAGEWVPLLDLVAFVGLREDRVTACLQGLVDNGQVLHGTTPGQAFYGVRTEGVPLPH
jgi:hypothetical protein